MSEFRHSGGPQSEFLNNAKVNNYLDLTRELEKKIAPPKKNKNKNKNKQTKNKLRNMRVTVIPFIVDAL